MKSDTANPHELVLHTSRTNICFPRAMSILSAALLITPGLLAQTDAPKPVPSQEVPSRSTKLYSMKFGGGDLNSLEKELKANFPKDNVVVTLGSKYIGQTLCEFEIRDVRLKELAKAMEFLSDGKLIVEVTEAEAGEPGNIWRIGSRLAATPPSLFVVKSRSVAAPHLFAEKGRAESVKAAASKLEGDRLTRIVHTNRAGYNDIVGGARVEMLPEQLIFVIVGTEDGIAGVESFIMAAEKLAADEASKKLAQASSVAPKMRAVLAPHLFGNQPRLERMLKEFDHVQAAWDISHMEMMKRFGIDDSRKEVRVEPRPDQKLFVLIGSEEGIAGMESLILASEKNAEAEDAREEAWMKIKKTEAEAARRKEAEAAEKPKKSE